MSFSKTLERLRALGFKKALSMKYENFLWTKVFSFFEPLGFSVLPAHFYSPVPDTRALRRSKARWYKPSSLAGINISVEEQRAFLRNLEPFREECASLPDYDWVTRQGLGEGYGLVDAHILYAMLRYHKPKRTLEVGSGVSTYFALLAAERNAEEGSPCEITCIEPYPRRGLTKLAESGAVSLIVKPVQDVPLETFAELGAGDLLFIDSSHVLKLDSDVWHLYLEVLPRLGNGVVTHIHDVFFPYPTPEPETWIFRQHQFWNETPLVQALLANNPTFRILVSCAHLYWNAPDALKAATPLYNPATTFASSLWIERTLPGAQSAPGAP